MYLAIGAGSIPVLFLINDDDDVADRHVLDLLSVAAVVVAA